MAREKGTFNFSANLEVKKQGPLDARQSLITYAELTQADTWQDEGGKIYLFDGLTVPVINGSEKQLYMLINAAQYDQTASWKRIDAGAAESGVKFINLSSLIPINTSHETILGVIGMLPNELIEEIKKSPILGICKDISSGSMFGSPISYIKLEKDVITDSNFDSSIEKGEYFSISLYNISTKSIISILIKFNKESNIYEKFVFNEDSSIRILDKNDIAEEKYINEYSSIKVAPAKVFNRALFLGDLHALQLNAEVSELYQVFKNLLDNEEGYYSDFETLFLEVSEKYNTFLEKNDNTGESTVFYSIINTSSVDLTPIYNPIKVSVCGKGNIGEGDTPLIKFCYELNKKIYTLGFSLNGGYIEKTETSLSDIYQLPGDITTLTNGMTGSALQAIVGTYSELKAAIDAKKVILCNIGGTSGSCPISARIVSGFVLLSTVYVDKAANKTITFGINLIPSTNSWATDSATAELYKKDLATTDTIPGSEFYKIPGDISTLSSSSSVGDIKGVYGDLNSFKAALTAKKAIMGTINDVVFYINAGLEDSTHILVSANSGIGIVNHRITISASDYVSIEVTENQLAVSGNVVETVTATTNKGLEIGGTATKPTVGLKLDTTTPGNIDLAVGANGLKATLSSKAVKSGDKVLKIETDKSISATVSLGYDSGTKKLQLKGINEEVFNELDATPFIKDGMLDSATLEVNPSGQSAGTYIKLVFNTESGKDPIYINVTSLIDVYVQGNGISISGKTIAVKLDTAGNSEGYLKLTAAGLKVDGIDSAIAAAITEAFSWHDVE